jgi:hypothetical protein
MMERIRDPRAEKRMARSRDGTADASRRRDRR